MQSHLCRACCAAVLVVCAAVAAACTSSSPVEADSTAELAARASRFEVAPVQIDLGTTGTSASITLKNNSNRKLSWNASENAGWLVLGANSGSLGRRSSKKLSLAVQRSGLAEGDYTTDVTITTRAGSETVLVRMTVSSSASSTFSVSPIEIDFGGTATSQSVTLTNSGRRSVTWTSYERVGWLSLQSTSGTIAARSRKTLDLTIDRTGRSDGRYTGKVKFAAGTAGSAVIPVSMTVGTTSEPRASVTLAGQLVDQFDGHALAGMTVEYNGSAVTTNAFGQFTIEGPATSSIEQLTLSGPGVYRRVTYAQTGDDRWNVVPASFDMTAFNDMARDEYGSGTVRWTAPPTVYVDSRPEGFTSSEVSTWITQVKTQAAEFISKWTGATIKPAAVIVTSNPPADYSPGTIVIHFSEDDSRYGNNSNFIGYARMSYSSSGVISAAGVWLRYLRYAGAGGADKRKGILGHELGHALGYGHMGGETLSFMEPSLGTKTDLSAFDRQAASLVYSRSPDNTSPDTDYAAGYRGALVPSGLPSTKEWICYAGEELTRTR